MMKRTIFALAMISILCTSCVKDMQEGTMNTEDTQTLGAKLVGRTDAETEKGVLLIKVDAASARRLEKDTGQETIADIFGSCGIQSVTYALGVRPGNIELARKFGLDRWYKVEYDKNSDNEEVARNLASRPNIESIQYNTFMEAPAIEQPVEADMPVMSRSASSDLEMPFNDPYLPAQWNMINDGSMKGSVAGADIGVKDAWKLAAGDPSIIVAVFDCAVSNIHSDLRDAVWVNEQEKGGSRGVDDDGNGYADDVYGFNFVGCRTEEQEDGSTIIVNSQNLDYTGRSGHGTHVAGVIGAVNGNGKGISSIAGGTGKKDGVRLLSCQIFDGTGSATDKQRGQAYVYAADMGACIAQCSYGNTDIITKDDIYINGIDGDDVPDSEKVKGSPFEYAALMYFLEKANHPNLDGNLAIYSSMNEGHPYSGYPGALSCCISVSAFGYDFTPGWYSNYGPGVKISAPGGEFTSEQDKHKAILSTGVSNAKEPSPSYTEDDLHYVYMNGTSMACPHVSGVAALGISYAMTLNKTFSREEFISKLLTSVNDLDQYCTGTKVYKNTLIDLSKYKGKMGTGALDAWKFLMALEGTPVIMAKPGAKRSIRIADYVGNNPVTLDPVDQETMSSLGWDTPPVITEDGMLEFTCTRTGAGKISFSSSIGKDPDMSDGIGGMNYNYEISITCRNNIASNGGWL